MKTKSLPKTRSVLALLAILGSLTFAHSSHAVPMLFTLTGVTFNDGATATGSVAFNPPTKNFGTFLITTTTSGSNTGSTYSSLAGTSTFYLASPDAFIFDNFSIDSHYFVFAFSGTTGHTATRGQGVATERFCSFLYLPTCACARVRGQRNGQRLAASLHQTYASEQGAVRCIAFSSWLAVS